MNRRMLRAFALVLVAFGWALAIPAAAHVELDSARPNGDGTVSITLTFDHGCGSSPTVALETSLPDGVDVESVDQPEGWEGSVADGTVNWSGTPIGEGEPAWFTIVATLDGAVGDTLRFDTVQRCENNEEYVWADPGQRDQSPAPRVVLTPGLLAEGPVGTDGAGPLTISLGIAGFVALAALLAGLAGRRFTR